MRANGFRSLSLALGALLALGAAPPPKKVSPDPKLPKVVLKELVDDRYGGGKNQSGLVLVLKLEGEGTDAYPAGRALVKEARDDSGRSLLPEKPKTRPYSDLGYGGLRVDLVAPPRSARSVNVSGTVELFAPKNDPAAVVKVPNALAKLDVPLASPGLSAAKIEVTLLSKARYAEELKKQSGPEATARLREAMKAEGETDEEISMMLEMRDEFTKAFASGESEHNVVLMAKNADFERIQNVKLIGPDGEELRGGMSGSSDGVTKIRCYTLNQAPDPGTTIVFTLYTDKARVSVPFTLKDVRLP
jgi:hypothetical protein